MTRFIYQLLAVMVCVFALLTLQVGTVSARTGGGVTSTLALYKVTHNDKGKEILVSAEQTEPGNIVEYQLKYTNENDGAIGNLRATLPIPAGMAYLENTAKPARAQASVDGKTFEDMPLKTTVKRDEKDVEVNIPCAEYRYLLWTVSELGAGKSVTFTARAKVTGSMPGQASSSGK